MYRHISQNKIVNPCDIRIAYQQCKGKIHVLPLLDRLEDLTLTGQITVATESIVLSAISYAILRSGGLV